MGTIYNSARQQGLIQTRLPVDAQGVARWKKVGPDEALAYLDGGSLNWDRALIDSGKPASQITLQGLTPDEVNAICSKLDMMFGSVENQAIANMIAEELPSILVTIEAVKWQTQSAFGGMLAQGTQLDIWPLRVKDVGGILLNVPTVLARGLYGAPNPLTVGNVFSWITAGMAGGTIANIVPAQTMWQYAGMIYLGALERSYTPKIEGIRFTLAGIASPPQPVTRDVKRTFGENSEISFFRLEKPVIVPPLKLQAVDIMPADSGTTTFEIIALVVAQSQNKAL